MNPPADQPSSAELRAEIDQTRRRMDETVDALGERFKGRHLVDEALHLFRTQTQNGNMNKFKDTLSRSADSAAHSVVDAVKSNPVPLLLIGAGIGLYLYNRRSSGSSRYEPPQSDYRDYRYRPELESEAGWSRDAGGDDLGDGNPNETGGFVAGAKDAAQGVGERLTGVKERVTDQMHAAADATRQAGAQVAERSRQLYRDGRDRAASMIEEHPLQSGLICLAVGLLAGIALPTSDRVRRGVAPQVRGLRRRASTVVAGGRQVVRRAAEAAREEARAQGLTMESGKPRDTNGGQAPMGTTPAPVGEQSPSI